jgi:epoxyqueuosine reductase QueG
MMVVCDSKNDLFVSKWTGSWTFLSEWKEDLVLHEGDPTTEFINSSQT